MIHLAFDPALVEEAVLLAEGRLPEADARAFRRERNKIYDITDPDRREKRFRSFHQDWFTLMRLDLAVRQTLGEYPGITSRLLSGRVVRAFDPREEGADLVDRLVAGAPDPQPVLVIRLRPASLANPDGLAPLLRHELMHVADMLDPLFGYQRTLSASEHGPSHDTIVRNRYQVLWDVTIDGRLARAGFGNERSRAARWREFAATFGMLGAGCRKIFDEWFDRKLPTHTALVDFVSQQQTTESTETTEKTGARS